MNTWQTHLELRAARASNRCQSCGQYGHHACECPKEVAFQAVRRLQIGVEEVEPKRKFGVVLSVCWFVAGVGVACLWFYMK